MEGQGNSGLYRSVYFSNPEQLERIKRIADRENRSVNHIVNRAIEEFLFNYNLNHYKSENKEV